MTATTTREAAPAEDTETRPAPPAIEEWRGVSAEGNDDISHRGGIRLRRRSRALLADLLRPYRRWIWVLIVAVVVENAARLSIPWMVRRGIDLGVPPLLEGGSGRLLYETVGLMVAAVVVQGFSRHFFLRNSGTVGQKVLLELRRRVFKHFQELDVRFHDRYTTGRVVSRLTSDIDAIMELLANGFDTLITAVLTMVGVGVLLLVLDFKLGAVCLLCFPLLMLLVRWFSRSSARTYRRVREMSVLTIVQFIETMTGIKAVAAYRREPRNSEIFEDVAGGYREANIDSFKLVAIFMPSVKLIGNLTIGVVLLYGGHRVIEGDMTVGVLAAFLLYLRMFFEPMQDISQFYNTFQSASSALEKLSGVLEEQPSVVEPVRPTPLPAARGDLHLQRVHFAYAKDRPVLPDLELHIPAGQTVALVGTTGAGKTTIAKLMARFYDPTDGRVTLDGIDLRDLSDTDLRRAVVMVTQENFMFDGSVADNIAFGKPTATRAEIEQAARAVGVHDFIVGLPHGYDTDVAKRGSRLSAGQRQLITFARAFLADPAVLILDEATSSLDVPSERLVQRALQTILADRTAVIIAHRLSTVEIADRVLVLEHGRIIEDGSPRELMADGSGRYAALHHAWESSLA
ncbi:MAG: Heterodimeric efflux ABC transporter, permease/ATP-binding subunit 2 [uncultured Friedmanniella sp.]|uniref:Heterodimeric efflux ABC transporter, permease/ATP-binding subunit 2 n=1 Tax=uncultured Friedmanniella sp. TaxID=335381 RepID=A0A6J4K4X5_9ACTN|nr:ABC transporter ATP-binding protein [uncultured Friedmanniella sp.]CAA9296121.1 MAG: Heterodimeric efflux ABC transporter, permease/ATP-binding subunit 2 [uncultured Friedmanniella sp.]